MNKNRNIVLGIITIGVILIAIGVNMMLNYQSAPNNSDKIENNSNKIENNITPATKNSNIPSNYKYLLSKDSLFIYDTLKKDSIKIAVAALDFIIVRKDSVFMNQFGKYCNKTGYSFEQFDSLGYIIIEKDSIWIDPLGKYFDNFDKIGYSFEQFAQLQFNYNNKDYFEIIDKNTGIRIDDIAIPYLYEAWKMRHNAGKSYYDLIDRAKKIIYDLNFIHFNMEFPEERGISDDLGHPLSEITRKICDDIQKNSLNLKKTASFDKNKTAAINKLKQICKERFNYIKKHDWSSYPTAEINEINKLITNDYLLKELENWLKVGIKDRWIWDSYYN